MVRRINISEKDRESVLSHECPKNPDLDKDYSGVVVNKPWGYEYLMFQNHEVAIWMLYIKKGCSMSLA